MHAQWRLHQLSTELSMTLSSNHLRRRSDAASVLFIDVIHFRLVDWIAAVLLAKFCSLRSGLSYKILLTRKRLPEGCSHAVCADALHGGVATRLRRDGKHSKFTRHDSNSERILKICQLGLIAKVMNARRAACFLTHPVQYLNTLRRCRRPSIDPSMGHIVIQTVRRPLNSEWVST